MSAHPEPVEGCGLGVQNATTLRLKASRDSDSIAAMRPARLLVLAACVLAAGCGGPEPPPFKPLADNKLLMQAMIDPNADLVWDAVKTIDYERRHGGNPAADRRRMDRRPQRRGDARRIGQPADDGAAREGRRRVDDAGAADDRHRARPPSGPRTRRTPSACSPSAATSTSRARPVTRNTWTPSSTRTSEGHMRHRILAAIGLLTVVAWRRCSPRASGPHRAHPTVSPTCRASGTSRRSRRSSGRPNSPASRS